MWLPTPIYERVPQFWLLIGLLFISSGVYLGFDYRLSFAYLFVGMLCIVWSITILIRRTQFRNKPVPTLRGDDEQAQAAEQAPVEDAPTGQPS